jgi:organic radical activating enzyme
MSNKPHKIFPIQTATACQLKWSHSTVFLTELKTSSCHRVEHDQFDLDTFDFHNTPAKITARESMLQGQWPGHGCEHCKNIEDVGGTSDRMLHLDFPGMHPPPELDIDPIATHVTPRILEIYFSNTCNLKCIYCVPAFSSQIKQENKKFGEFSSKGVYLPDYVSLPEEYPQAYEKMFEWLDKNIHTLDKLLVLGGEPFIQKQTQELLDFISLRELPNLDLVIFSNLTIEHEKFKRQIDQLKQIEKTSKLNQINVIGSIDCWGPQAEYVRSGLDLNLFEKNFNYLVYETNFILNINSVLSSLTIPSMPGLVEKINHWSETRIIYWSMMKAGGKDFLHPTIFGNQILELGFNEALDKFKTFNDPEKTSYLDYFRGIAKEIEQSSIDIIKQKQLKIYISELDRRRNTDYTKIFPGIAELLTNIEI